jgi:Tfp pilus assembly protein PilN
VGVQSWPLLAVLAANVTPVDQATSSLISYVLGYGVLGIVAVALAFRFIVPRSAVEDAREQARSDLIAQVGRLERQIEQLQREKKEAEDQREDQMKFAQVQLVPLLVNFTSATAALIPLLQELVRHREGGDSDPRRHR